MDTDDRNLVECTCKDVCGEGGKKIIPSLRKEHLRTQLLREALSSVPPSSLADLGAVTKNNPSSSAHPHEAAFEAGRALVTGMVTALDAITALQRKHRELRKVTFRPSDLVLRDTSSLPTRPSAGQRTIPRLDPRTHVNRRYIKRGDDLRRLLGDVEGLDGCQDQITKTLKENLRDDIAQTIEEHESIAVAAGNLQVRQTNAYAEEGHGALIVGTSESHYL